MLFATRSFWLLQEVDGSYSKLLVAPIRLFFWQSHKTQEAAGWYKKSQEVTCLGALCFKSDIIEENGITN